jgi:hypothetical protein
MFVMEEVEQCGSSIIKKRELDYMRNLDTWNLTKGYNCPNQEANYARRLYFSLNPGQEARFWTLKDREREIADGWRESIPSDQKWMEELREVAEISLREGRGLMEMIPSLASPVVLASPPSA